MKKLLIIFLISAFIISCSDSGNNPSEDNSVLMPLKIGNTWEYKTYFYYNEIPDTITYRMIVDSEFEYKGVKYHKLKVINNRSNDSAISKELYINKSDGLYILTIYDDADIFNRFKYPTYNGESFTLPCSEKFYTEDINYEYETPIGKFKCIKYVNIRYYEENEIERTYTFYSPNIGLIALEFYTSSFEGGGVPHLFAKYILINYSLKWEDHEKTHHLNYYSIIFH